MLLDRGAPGDREKARTLIRDALETYTQIGMPRHIEMTHALLDQGWRSAKVSLPGASSRRRIWASHRGALSGRERISAQ
jgi:hypothetical protein